MNDTLPRLAEAPLRLLVVDDHALFRSGLATLLRDHGYEIVGEAASGEEGVRLAGLRIPDVVLMDLSLPGISGIEATRRVRELLPGSAVLVVTASLGEDDVIEALLAGAVGYVLKDAAISHICEAIEAAVVGEVMISPRLNRKLVERLRSERTADAPEVTATLSPRELEVLGYVVAGLDNAEIAERLHLSPSTVKNQVSTILVKLRVSNRVQAAVHAVRTGLIAA